MARHWRKDLTPLSFGSPTAHPVGYRRSQCLVLHVCPSTEFNTGTQQLQSTLALWTQSQSDRKCDSHLNRPMIGSIEL